MYQLGSVLVDGARHDETFWRSLTWRGLAPTPVDASAESAECSWELRRTDEHLTALV